MDIQKIISYLYSAVNKIQKEVGESHKPITSKVKGELIEYGKEIIEYKKKIGANYSQDEDFVNKIIRL